MWRSGHQAAGDADAHLGQQLFGGLGAVAGDDLGNGVGEFETAAVGPVSQRLDLANAGQALLEQIVFQRQISLLWGN